MDLAAVAQEIESAQPKRPDGEKRHSKRAPLPVHLLRHEPTSTTCRRGCTIKRIGERADPGSRSILRPILARQQSGFAVRAPPRKQ